VREGNPGWGWVPTPEGLAAGLQDQPCMPVLPGAGQGVRRMLGSLMPWAGEGGQPWLG